uniref:G-protein coupled receptors family 1 profile domain-containing protein n=1 Tax=Sus scrofa TaxID=9823 RepID=A0A8D0K7A3_PIG
MDFILNHPASNKTSVKGNSSAFIYFESCRPASLALLLLLIAYSLVLIIGFFGNLSLLIIIFKKQREAQNVTNILIANLSLSDILVCIMCLPFTIIYTLMDHWIFGEIMCKLTSYVQSVSISVSIFSLVLIAVERYQLIVNPQGWKPSAAQAYWAACVEKWASKMNQLLFTTSLFLLQYWVPLGFILICYLKIVICLRRRNGKVDKKRESWSRLRENKRVNKMLISIVVTFGACWLPLNIFNVIFDWYHEVLMSCQHDLVFVVCHLVAMVSTCINPLFYGFFNKNFQKDLVLLIHYCWCFEPQERYENTAISSMHTDESKGSLRLSYTSTSI